MEMADAPLWYFVILAGMFGAAFGSFLNVCIYRWPADESVLRPPSRCPGCGHGLAWYDNIPVLGYLFLRGKCRYCGRHISMQYPIIEAITALLWIACVLYFGATLEAVRAIAFLTILLGIAMTDAREMVIPDQFSLGGTALGLILAAIPGDFPFRASVIGALLGYVLLWVIKIIAEKALRKPALGVGDIHMMAFVGAFVGWQGALLTLMAGSVAGLVVGVPYTWIRGKLSPMATYLPLGTFLAMGAALTFFWGDAIIGWYAGIIAGS
jgi:leader peptidase (prepilin peptidase)/N-methyltransferase